MIDSISRIGKRKAWNKILDPFKETCLSGCGLLLFSFTPQNETGDMPRENCQNSASNAMIDYSMVKCKLMEPRIGTGYTFSERSEFYSFFSDP